MINRNIKEKIVESLDNWPITLITGSRQIGKTTICKEIAKEKGYHYVSLDDLNNREKALNDPTNFVKSLNVNKLIIDEIQYVPKLFDVLTSIVNKTKFEIGEDKAYGMFIITGSQSYHLMQGVTESMAGRVNIIEMSNLSMNELNNNRDIPFVVDNDVLLNNESKHNLLAKEELFKIIIKGFYPELHNNKNIDIDQFYSNYVDSYISRDVKQLTNIRNAVTFNNFLKLLATYSGQELTKENLSKVLQIDRKTVDTWLNILITGDIVSLVQPYFEFSLSKRIVRKNKLYFNDTGLLCYLLGIQNYEIDMIKSKYRGAIFETYVFNEIRKSYLNNLLKLDIYFYRDNQQNEIDFIIKKNGKLNLVEVKSGSDYTSADIKAFDVLIKSDYVINGKCIICTTNNSYAIKNELLVYPYNVI